MFKISTTNPEFSYIIQKNPHAEKLFKKALRGGKVEASFSQNLLSYYVLFTDDPKKPSYGQKEMNYLDISYLSSPMLIYNIVDTVFRTAYKEGHEKDTVPAQAEFYLPRLKAQKLSRAFDFNLIVVEDFVGNVSKVYVNGHTVQHCLQVVTLFTFLAALDDRQEDIFIDDSLIEKILDLAVNLRVDYLARNILKVNMFRSKPKFNAFKGKLAESQGDVYTFEFGNTLMQRKAFLMDELEGGEHVVDFGCGEGNHTFWLAQRYEKVTAIDKDFDLLQRVLNNAQKRKLENINVTADLSTFCKLEFMGLVANKVLDTPETKPDLQILATEVLEHMPLAESLQVFSSLLAVSASKIVVTVPNLNFTEYYNLDTEFRHDDHDWEYTEDLLPQFKEIADREGYSLQIKQLGDSVNGNYVTTAMILEKQ